MILYVHGFASCGRGNKSQALARHFGSGRVVAPDLPPRPRDAVAALEAMKAQEALELIVGSSLGAFYTLWLNRARPVPAVLINPALEPWTALASCVGTNHRWCDGSAFRFGAGYLDELQQMRRDGFLSDERYLVLLQTGDEVLDWQVAAQRLARFEVIVEQGGNHRFENLPDYLPRIPAFLEAKPQSTPETQRHREQSDL
jgi:predicted esterase YcpF (UPF0227 family)